MSSVHTHHPHVTNQKRNQKGEKVVVNWQKDFAIIEMIVNGIVRKENANHLMRMTLKKCSHHAINSLTVCFVNV